MVHRPPFAPTLRGALLALALTLVACPGGDEPADEPEGLDAVAQREAEEARRQRELEASGRGRSVREADPDAQPEAPLAFATITISPEAPKMDVEELKVRSTLQPGASPFTEVEFEWSVGGRKLVGYKRAKLAAREGNWQPGDTIEVVAVATDENGRVARSEVAKVVIGNSTPVITTDLSRIKYLHGTRLRATDDDGDEVTWSVEGDPPGVTISKDGVIRQTNVQLDKEWTGEAVFVATDPYGARSEIHIPMSVNAAREAEVQEAGEKKEAASYRQMTDEELNRAAERDARRFENMSEEEINAELDRRDALDQKK